MEFGNYHFTWVPSPKSLEVNLCNLSCWEHGSWELPLHTVPKSQVTWGQFVQSHLLRAWKLGITTSHGSQPPSHLRSICAISAVESMKVGNYHFILFPSPKSLEVNLCNLSCWEDASWELPLHTVPKSQVTWGQFVQSQLLRAWKLRITTSHCSQVLSHLRLICAISAVERMKVGTYHPKSPSITRLLFLEWSLGACLARAGRGYCNLQPLAIVELNLFSRCVRMALCETRTLEAFIFCGSFPLCFGSGWFLCNLLGRCRWVKGEELLLMEVCQ